MAEAKKRSRKKQPSESWSRERRRSTPRSTWFYDERINPLAHGWCDALHADLAPQYEAAYEAGANPRYLSEYLRCDPLALRSAWVWEAFASAAESARESRDDKSVLKLLASFTSPGKGRKASTHLEQIEKDIEDYERYRQHRLTGLSRSDAEGKLAQNGHPRDVRRHGEDMKQRDVRSVQAILEPYYRYRRYLLLTKPHAARSASLAPRSQGAAWWFRKDVEYTRAKQPVGLARWETPHQIGPSAIVHYHVPVEVVAPWHEVVSDQAFIGYLRTMLRDLGALSDRYVATVRVQG